MQWEIVAAVMQRFMSLWFCLLYSLSYNCGYLTLCPGLICLPPALHLPLVFVSQGRSCASR